MSAGGTPPGWYPDVERAGGERYWDGSTWTESRRAGGGGDPTVQGFGGTPNESGPPQYGQPSSGVPQYGQPQYGAPSGYQPYGAFGTTYAKQSKSGLAVGLSIGSIFLSFCCGLGIFLAIPGAILGWQEMKSIDRGEIDASTRGTAKAAFIIGTIVIGLTIAALLFYVVLIAAGSV
jgi:uncharacterized iron-regulated membrane protein